ncbi:MAG: DNA polymerase III subunit gamma/tau [Firmicutes bacterium]|nr:DNA polymerase III subunit gamma/tau [Bacillota bacterium]
MGYVSLYRKWRPQSFDDIVGQDHIVTTLVNSLASGRLTHAYLFAGPRGTGKTTAARLLAKGLNCRSGPTAKPCGSCLECTAITKGSSLNVVEIDGASNRGIDDVRELRSQVQFTPINAAYKVYIIDEVHMLTAEAFNALLKTLEEPPAHVVFIFATTDPHRLPLTILSRVQRFDFRRFSTADIMSRLETVVAGEQLQVEEGALQLMAAHAEGGMRDALGILEKCAAYTDHITELSVTEVLGVASRELIASFCSYLLRGQKVESLQLIDQLYNEGKDLQQFVRGVVTNFRREIIAGSGREEEKLKLEAIRVLSETLREMKFAVDPRIPLEVAVLKIVLDSGREKPFLGDLEQKVLSLEKKLAKISETQQLASKTRPETSSAGLSRPAKGDQKEYSTYILSNWEAFLQNLKSERLMQCEAFLREGTPLIVEDDALVVAFPRDRGFHKASMEQDNHREPAERVLSKFLGTSLHLKCVFADNDTNIQREEAAAEESAALELEENKTEKLDPQEEEFIAASKRIFGGEVLIRPRENKSEEV